MDLQINPRITKITQLVTGEVTALEINGQDLYNELKEKFMNTDKDLSVEMVVAEDTEHDGKVKVTITTSEKGVVLFYSTTKADATLLSGTRVSTSTGKTATVDNLTASGKLYVLAVKESYKMTSAEISLA